MKKARSRSPEKKTVSRLLLAGLVAMVLLIIVVFLYNGRFDKNILSALSYQVTVSRTHLMLFITFYGSHFFLIPANLVLITLLLTLKKKKLALQAAIVALSSLGLMNLLKILIHRARPRGPLVLGVTNFSFPSGHSFMSMAFYGLLIGLAIKFMKSPGLKILVIIILSLLIFLIGFSRVYLRMHYPTDVLGGWIIGCYWLMFSFYASGKLMAKYSLFKTPSPKK